jgi:hypothetical protein
MTTSIRDADPYLDIDFDPASPNARRMLDAILAAAAPSSQRTSHNRRRVSAAVVSLAAAAVVAALVVVNTDAPSTDSTQALGAAGYRVTAQSDGTVQITVRWSEVRDPKALQRSLDQAQARTKIRVLVAPPRRIPTGSQIAPPISHSDQDANWCGSYGQYFTGKLNSRTVQYNNSKGEDGIVIRPKYFPTGVTLLVTVTLSPPSSTSSHTSSAGQKVEDLSTQWVTGGPVADCS